MNARPCPNCQGLGGTSRQPRCARCGGVGVVIDPPDKIEQRLAALEAEHAKALSRIERLERLLAHALDEVQQTALESTPPWVRTLWDAMHDELAEIDRERFSR